MEKQTKQIGLGLCDIIFVIFLTLKLTGTGAVAAWSWWWIFSPLWIPLLILVLAAMLASLFS